MQAQLLALLHREWLQNRWAWALTLLIPFGLALLGIAIGPQMRIEGEGLPERQHLPLILASISAMAGPVLMLFMMAISALANSASLPRRDHGDRSIEFWLSLPTPHSTSLAVPMGTHLLLAPAVGVVLGWLGGLLLGPLLLQRLGGLDAWSAVPWSAVIAGSGALVLRVLAGLPLAALWMLPVLLLLMLLNAWFGRRGWLVMVAGLGLASLFERLVLGQLFVGPTINSLLQNSLLSFFGASGRHFAITPGDDAVAKLQSLPGAAAQDYVAALGMLASPLFIGGLLFSAACFYLLAQWRQRDAAMKD